MENLLRVKCRAVACNLPTGSLQTGEVCLETLTPPLLGRTLEPPIYSRSLGKIMITIMMKKIVAILMNKVTTRDFCRAMNTGNSSTSK